MWTYAKYLISLLHVVAVCGLAGYGSHRFWLLLCWFRVGLSAASSDEAIMETGERPFVTVQLPVYNERFVAARLISATAAINWPTDRFEIQVLDDSTDETKCIIDREAETVRKQGIAIHIVRRDKRLGYKAGALQTGLGLAGGEFIAVFDADFIPPSDFLERTIPCFTHPRIGMVQARWRFINNDHSWLTRIQSLLIGPHFSIEHLVRFNRGLFFNFNGTAGVWRRLTIESAGGWRDDTVTEDLDISYRAQMAGWRFVYLDDLEVPCELPSTLPAFRTQQQRWAKGSIQTARKILPLLLRSDQSPAIKMEACAHLLANLGWMFGALATLLLYPLILSRIGIGAFQLLRFDIPLIGFGIGTILLFFLLYGIKKSDFSTVVWLPLLPVFSIGIAPSIALAVLHGGITWKGRFERTPKFGGIGRNPLPHNASVYHRRSLFYALIDMGLAAYCLLPIHFACQQQTWIAIPFLLIFPAGFILVAVGELEGIRKSPVYESTPEKT
jgi:cellulose synthase/poly-beta-1,6-N-acetylglucosamine synthase-like glycosyltransferase